MGKKIRRPREPAVGECCGSGCTRCVYDVYYDALMAYEENKLSSSEEEEEESNDSSLDEEDAPKDYIGSVVIKYLDNLSPKDVAKAEERIHQELEHKYTALESLELLKSSHPGVDQPSIHVLSVQPVSPIPTPHPGDVVEVFVPNDHPALDHSVEHLCRRLRVDPDAGCLLRCSPFVPEAEFPPWLPRDRPLTVRQLLSNYVDISSSSYLLRPAFFQSLLRLHHNSSAKAGGGAEALAEGVELLRRCASAADAGAVFRAIANGGRPLCYPCLAEVLELFAFVRLPLERMLEITGPLQPRKFSIAGHRALSRDRAKSLELCLRQVVASREGLPSPAIPNETALHFANLLNDVAFRRADRRELRSSHFYGHTTNPLVWEATRGAARPLGRGIYLGTSLFGTSSFGHELKKALRGLSSGGIEARMTPVILLAAGTGIAPLIAGVRELWRAREETARGGIAAPPYSCMVMYGSKTKAELVYHDTLLAAREGGAISSYDYALSRQADDGKAGERITDLLERNAAYLRDALLNLQGKLFCCGPAKAMEAVRSLLEKKIFADPDDDESMQQHRIHFLAEKKQILFDVWTSIGFLG
ncbi:unnamed protein product [Phytomonas sp. Hart1]|nr:unnamed protein product [Phytomonas sp. Hart1]|eukprot:CCW71866.1 unnamed protein product [Phytomonas sp. isolate Hart1]